MGVTLCVKKLVKKRADSKKFDLDYKDIENILNKEVEKVGFIKNKVIFSNFFLDDKGKLNAHLIPPILP